MNLHQSYSLPQIKQSWEFFEEPWRFNVGYESFNRGMFKKSTFNLVPQFSAVTSTYKNTKVVCYLPFIIKKCDLAPRFEHESLEDFLEIYYINVQYS